MHLADSSTEATFRQALRSWLAANLTPEIRRETALAVHRGDSAPSRAWQRMLHQVGYTARSWPEVYGGHGGAQEEDLILFEELALAEAPNDIFRVGVRIIGPMLMRLGTAEQKQQLLPPTADGRCLWSQGFSEPEAGSDVASLKTRADWIPGGYRLNGQKVWNTFGHMADYSLVLARTDASLPKHKGLTAFVLPLNLPRITIRPIPQMSGRSDFNEIFFENVEVPAASVVGEVNNGWRVAITMLEFERRGMAAAGFECLANFRRLVRLACLLRRPNSHRLIEIEAVRRRLVSLGVQTRMAQLNNHRFAAMTVGDTPPGAEGSVQKLHSTELNKALLAAELDFLMEAEGDEGEGSADLLQAGENWLGSFGFTIGGGTAQIQRNIIAERLLGMPR